MNLRSKYGTTALVAGASEGLGAAFSLKLAAEGMDVILLARGREKLEKTAAEISTKFKVKTYPIACDLGDEILVEKIKAVIGELPVDLLVYNAALSHIGPYTAASIEAQTAIAEVNMIGLMRLSHHFGEGMLQRKRGAQIIMCSLAGFQGSGFLTTYAATKAFCRNFAEGLWYEWKDRGVDVLGVCAGATATPNYLNTKPKALSFFAPKVQSPEEVVEEAFQKLGKTPSFVTGAGNKLASFFMSRLMPRKMAIMIMGNTTRGMYDIRD